MAFMTGEHIVQSYADELTQLASSVSEMGGRVEAAVVAAVQALLRLDHPMAQDIIAGDKRIDEIQRRIDEAAVSMIARRQPMAKDLRMIITALQVASDLERIGDMAKQIARRTLQIDSNLFPSLNNGVRHMMDLVTKQVKTALDAYTSGDARTAVEVCNKDDEVDALYTSIFRELLTYMMEDPRNITVCTHLLFCAKSLERVGDHATNVAEAAYYLHTGRQLSDTDHDLHRQQIRE